MTDGSANPIWIVHRDDRARTALVRLLGISDAVVGRPGDVVFDQMPSADAIVLGLSGAADRADAWEAELEFVQRHQSRVGAARWVLVGGADDREAAIERFDRIPVDFLAYPPTADALRRAARRTGRRPTLSDRARREAVAAQFSRWFADVELPELLRAIDPRLADVPLLVRGEPGTGRATVIRYAHHFGGTGIGALAHIPCAPDVGLPQIETALTDLSRARPDLPSLGVWLEEPGQLGRGVQRQLAAWLEAGPPPGVRAPLLRWFCSVDEAGAPLDPRLEENLGTIQVRLAPLREQPDRVVSIVREVTERWARQRREEPRTLDPAALNVLREYPWPGNVRELETVLERTLASTARNPLRADDLLGRDDALAPLDASEVGTLLSDDEVAELDETDAPRHGAGPWLPGSPATAAATDPNPGREPEVEIVQESGALHPAEPDPGLRRLASALIHQVRNPLTTIRTFAELLPERFDDPDFRARFPRMVREDVGRIHSLLGRLEQLAALDAPRHEKVDVSELLEHLLEARRDAFRARHLLVLKELDSGRPNALADPDQLRLAFEALLDKAIATVPERGDVYIASRRQEGSSSDGDTVRVLLRFPDPTVNTPGAGGLERSIELLIAELVVRAQGGRFTVGASDSEERILVIDLPTT